MAIDFTDLASRYAQRRWDQATQPFTDPEAYFENRLDQRFGATEEGNTKPLSTTITYNDDGSQTVTNKHEVGASAPVAAAPAPVYVAPTMPAAPAAPAPAPAPAAMAAPQPVAPAQDFEEQRRKQLEAAQLANAQAQQVQLSQAQQAAAQQQAEAPVAAPVQPVQQAMPAVGPMSQPTAGAGPTPGQAPVTQVAAPVNPAAPQMPELPQPGPGVQLAGPMVQGAVPTVEVAPKPQWQTDLDAAQNDATKLAAFVGNESNPAEARKIASEKWQQLLTKTKEEEKGNKILLAAAQGDPKATNDLARHLKSRSEEGSYLKAILFARLGLSDLAKEEQAKLSVGGLESTMLGGSHYTVERNKAGGITRAWDAEGNSVGDKDIARLNAEALTTKGIETGKTLYKTPDGSVYSFSTMPGRPGGIWTNMTSGAVSQTAPKGVTPFGQQDPAVVRGLQLKAAAEKQARIDNEKAGGTRYTEAQIIQLGNDAFRSFTGYNFSPRIAEAASEAASTGYVAPPAGPRPEVGAVEQSQAGQAGAALSPALQDKIISAQRTWDEQNRLYQQSVAAGTPGTLPNGNPVAKPGTSAHEGSGAIDIDAKKLTRQDRLELAQAGYYQPLPNDPNHWERVSGAPSAAPTTRPIDANSRVREQMESMAQSIANYETKPLTAGGSQGVYNQAVMARVRELNPTYDDTKYAAVNKTRQAFATGKQGDTVRSMNVAVDHLATLDQAATALNNGQLPILNKIMNEFSKNTGHPAVTNFEGIKSIVGSEVAKAVSGAGGSALGDREEIRREINAANSPQQLAGVIKKYQDLMAGQLKGLRLQYEDAGLKDFNKKIAPETKRVLERIERENKNTRSSW